MDILKETPGNFIELVEYAKMRKFCTKPFCTTCGSMDFRKFLREVIGRDSMIRMISDATREELKEHSIEEWRDVLTLMTHELGIIFPRNNVLIEEYEADQYEWQLLKESRKKEFLRTEEQKQLDAETKRSYNKNKHKEETLKSNVERVILLAGFKDLDLNQKLLKIAEDNLHLPNYYPIDFKSISDDDLRLLPKSTIGKLALSFEVYKKLEWSTFYQRIIKLVNCDM